MHLTWDPLRNKVTCSKLQFTRNGQTISSTVIFERIFTQLCMLACCGLFSLGSQGVNDSFGGELEW